jgi:hypothetical protein
MWPDIEVVRKASGAIEVMERTGLLWVRERSMVFWSSCWLSVDRTDILRSAEVTRSCGGFVSSCSADHGVCDGVMWTARMLAVELRELRG